MAEVIVFDEDRLPKGMMGKDSENIIEHPEWNVIDITPEFYLEHQEDYYLFGLWRGELVDMRNISKIGKWLVEYTKITFEQGVTHAVPFEAGSSPPNLEPRWILIKDSTYADLTLNVKKAKIDQFKTWRLNISKRKLNVIEDDLHKLALKAFVLREINSLPQDKLDQLKAKINTFRTRESNYEDLVAQVNSFWEPADVENACNQFDSTLE